MKTLKFFAILFFGLVVCLSACKKDTKNLPVDFIDPNSNFDSEFESFFLDAYTAPMDSLGTHQQSLYILGAINDPIFGVSRASIATSYSIPANAASFTLDSAGIAPIIDSVILQLRIGNDSTLAGNPNAAHNIKVYELAEKLTTDSIYFSNRNYKKSSTEIGSYNGSFSPKDSILNTYYDRSFKIPASMRIKLSDDFKNKLLNTRNFSIAEFFYDNFRGFVIEDESNFAMNDGGFYYFNLNSVYTNLIVYYRNSTTFTPKRAEFPILSGNARYNKYETNSTNLTQANSVKISPTKKRDTCYLQSMAGTKVRVFIPDSLLNKLAANPKLAVLKAELVLNVLSGFNSDVFKTPNQLTILSTDSLGRGILTEDSKSESFVYFGGGITGNNEYKFNIAREFNYLLNSIRKQSKNQHYGLSIIVPNSTLGSIFQTSARRAVIDGKNIKLNLNYTVIK